jgi:hypothetical protein
MSFVVYVVELSGCQQRLMMLTLAPTMRLLARSLKRANAAFLLTVNRRGALSTFASA